MSYGHEKQFEEDIQSNVKKVMQENPSMSALDALSKVEKDMLKNNPFVPPTSGCPINILPNELISHIFFVGMTMEAKWPEEDEMEEQQDLEDELNLRDGWDTDDDEEVPGKFKWKDSGKGTTDDEEEEEEEEEEAPKLPFQVLCSHVCRRWYEVAVDSPLLWTKLDFHLGTSLDMAKIWLERSKGHPLEILIDCTTPEDWVIDDGEEQVDVTDVSESVPSPPSSQSSSAPQNALAPHDNPCLTKAQVSEILDVIIPAVDRWRLFSVNASHYDSIYLILERFSKCSSAQLLEILEMYHNEDCEEFETFSPPELNTRFLPFNGNAPNLKSVAFWGVHIDWDASLSLLNDLRDLEIAFHADDVRPSFQTFSDILAGSPELEALSLCLSGPADKKEDWGTTPIEMTSVKKLTLCHHEPAYIESLLPLLHLPNVIDLLLDYDSNDYTEFTLLLAKPLPGRTKSLLAGLEQLKINCLPSSQNARQLVLEQLLNLKTIILNCTGDEEEFFERLMELKQTPSKAGTSQSVAFCPHLTTLITTGIDGAAMRKFVEARKQGGAPLSKVSMSEEDFLEEKEEKWLREHLVELDFFEPSESEEELVEIDGDDDAMDTDSDLD
ncbi:hypothetical protein BT96DRAFT_955791 [Gymnopus androsaceus JB14]|uniref:F-box domain-containing protein n=1 Tax=Gymnopus androsaceus JB14 TaxID=1447944 RepID=A0A6A4I269_9AGAR|nr:hypothetical protein BT96DRAFT_955791 [Gymnopus androsaceus JB14]